MTADLDPANVTRFDGIRVVTPARAILDGIERHLDGRTDDRSIWLWTPLAAAASLPATR